MIRTVEYGGESITDQIRFLATRRTLGIDVHPDLRVGRLMPDWERRKRRLESALL